MTPDPEEIIRRKLRHFRRAEHELAVAADLHGYFVEEAEAARRIVEQLVVAAHNELQRMRDLSRGQ